MKCLNKKNILMILLIIYFISYSSALTFFSKKVLLEESKEIDILITSFYESLENKNFDLVEELFYDKKINILIESNKIMENYNNSKYLGRINNINDISKYFLLTELTGKKISESIVSKDFVSQPYDYPIGNIFYVKVSNEYEKKVINDYFFIIKDENSFKIYELKKIILPQI